jgi:hypothetical protein
VTDDADIPLFDDEWRSAWQRRLADSAELAHVGRWCNLELVISRGGEQRAFQLAAGRLVDEPVAGAERIVLAGSHHSWSAFLAAVPPPFHNSVLGMDRRCDDFSVAEGRQSLTRHLRALEVVFAAARQAAGEVRRGARPEVAA